MARHPLLSLCMCALCSFILGGVVTLYAASLYPSLFAQGSPPTPLRVAHKDLPLVNQLLLCNINDQKNISSKNQALEAEIQRFVTERVRSGAADNISVYTINYATGAWTGVNEDDRYDPASMLKVPVMIAYFAEAERDPTVLARQLTPETDTQNQNEYFKGPTHIKKGVPYTVDALIASMIQNSDNVAATLLQGNIDPMVLSEAFSDLGLPVPSNSINPDYISVKLYAYFFRVLYNVTYLTGADSEKALELLAQTDFPQGIRAGVPAEVTVAHKFGERGFYNPDLSLIHLELHDCGIVYKPGSNYLLCIMSQGKDYPALTKNISDLSALVYQRM